MGRDFTDSEFKSFVVTLDVRRDELRKTLAAWKKVDLAAAAERPLRYLPDEATSMPPYMPSSSPR